MKAPADASTPDHANATGRSMVTLSVLSHEFGVCRLNSMAEIPAWAMSSPFFSITRTPDELSVVCATASIPEGVSAERGWRCLKVCGPLDFAETGILLSLARPLARAGISIFAISTYDTDYLLLKARDLARAIVALRSAGHTIQHEDVDLLGT